MTTSFNLTAANISRQIVGSFSGMTFSGYTTNGSIVLSSVCLTNVNVCKVNRIYVVTVITANNWFFGIAGGAGILGVGANSPYLR